MHLPRSAVLTPTRVAFLTALFLILSGNATFFSRTVEVYAWSAQNAGFLVSVPVVLGCVFTLAIAVLGVLIPIRFIASVFILVAAATGYAADNLGTVFDLEMVRSVFETDAAEAADLMSAGYLWRLFALGVVPVLVLWRLRFQRAGRGPELRFALTTVASTIVVSLLCLFSFSAHYTNFFREHKPLRYYTNPTYAFFSVGKLLLESSQVRPPEQIRKVAMDAVPGAKHNTPKLVVLVVGETVRRDRFSLNGYARITNPELAREPNLVSFTDIKACGTTTAVSVPCMFSLGGRETFDVATSRYTENVLDVLHRVGVTVLWRDNNSGSKGVADRVLFEDFRSPEVNPSCDSECRDVGMLHGLQDFIEASAGDVLIVLHQFGNHGPAYFQRYPPAFERFKPACQSIELSDCTDAQISNAYDNAVLYTDFFLSRVIALLKSNTDRFETAMLYASDHGESLGENGLYLHGLPHLLAPSAQTDVPLVLWTGKSSRIDLSSARANQHKASSHDALSHSLLTAFEVQTKALKRSQALFTLRPVKGTW